MIYIVLFLLLLGGWQAFMRGSRSQVISGISLWLAIIFLIAGLVLKKIEVSIVLFALFVLVSTFILMQIYRFSTYHRYFPKILPILLGYGILIGYLLFAFNFSQYFLWHVILTGCFLTINYRKQQRLKALILLGTDEEQKKHVDKSAASTIRLHLFSSILYVIAVIISFIYFYNV